MMAKEKAPNINWNFVSLPNLPALPKFVTREAAAAKRANQLKVLRPPKSKKPAMPGETAAKLEARTAAAPPITAPLAIIDPDDPTKQPVLLSKNPTKSTTSESAVAAQAIAEVAADRIDDEAPFIERDDRVVQADVDVDDFGDEEDADLDRDSKVARPSPRRMVANYACADDPEHQDIDLTYHGDEPAAAVADSAHVDEADPVPSEAAVIPPVEEQKPVMGPPEIRTRHHRKIAQHA